MPSQRCIDLELHYSDRGQGRPVLFLHGYPQNHTIWQPVIDSMIGNYRCVALDLPGFGQSEKSLAATYFYDEQVARVASFIKQCFDVPIDIVSHDYGSLLAMGVGAQHPELVRSLVISNCRAHRTFRQPWYAVLRLVEGLSKSPAGRWLLTQLGVGTVSRWLVETDYPQHPHALCDPGLQQRDGVRALLRFYEQGYDTRIHPGFTTTIKAIRAPTLILWGERDRYLDPRIAHELQAMMPGSRLVMFLDGHHYLIDQFPDRVRQSVEAFLATA